VGTRKRLKDIAVMLERHVCTLSYVIHPNWVPKIEMTLTTAHRLGRNRALKNRNSKYRDSTYILFKRDKCNLEA